MQTKFIEAMVDGCWLIVYDYDTILNQRWPSVSCLLEWLVNGQHELENLPI